MLLDVAPLRKYRDYRLLFVGQLVSFLGTMVSYMAVPYQVYTLTHSNAWVGALGLVQLGPVLAFGLLGGAYADRINRRVLLLGSELLMAVLVGLLWLNSLAPQPSVVAIFVLVGILQAVTGFHRPAMEALTQTLVDPADYASIGALGSFRSAAGQIGGPLLGGLLVASFGVHGAYAFDLISFAGAVLCVAAMERVPDPEKSQASPLADAREGIRFALSKPELVGTYLVDIVAMLFAFPVALFPAMGERWGGAEAAGALFSAMAVGSLLATLFSGWSGKVERHGRMVVFAAAFWGLFVVGVGLAPTLPVALVFLALAGAADMISGLFRGVIWNRTVPNALRGRLSGIEMISYLTGPLLGNARAGWMASEWGVRASLTSGGLLCALAVVATSLALPRFWAYRAEGRGEPQEKPATA